MSKQTDIGKMADKALESLDGIQRAEPRPFLFTRVKALLEREKKNIWELTGAFLARPVVAVAGLCLILALNVFILFQKEPATTSQPIVLENIASQDEENIFASVNTYDYENLEP